MLNLVLVVFLLVGLTSCEFSGLVSDPQISKRGERKRGRNHRKYIKRSQSRLDEEANSILDGSDRYNLWWTGPTFAEGSNWRRAEWSAEHQPDTNAIFTVAVTRGPEGSICSSPLCHLRLFLGSARRSGFTGDIVIAVDGRRMTPEAKQIMLTHRAVVYQLPSDICSVGAPTLGDTGFSAGYFCGSEQERIPVSVFRYYVYEKWTALYDENSLIFLSDFQDVIFQSDPFTYRRQEWQEYALVVFQSFHPNMLINRAPEYSSLLQACYGANVLNLRGSMIAVTPGAFMGTRNGILSFSRAMTTQLQDAPGRVSETRCSSQGIDKAMANYLVYNARQRNLCRTKVYAHGDGALNSLEGMAPQRLSRAHLSTPNGNLTGPLGSFWNLLRTLPQDGNNYSNGKNNGNIGSPSLGLHVINWRGDVAPVVHQLHLFSLELSGSSNKGEGSSLSVDTDADTVWEKMVATRGLIPQRQI